MTYLPLIPFPPEEELAAIRDAIDRLRENKATIRFEYRLKVRRDGEAFQVVRSNTLQEAADLITGPKVFTICERPSLPRHRWRTHIINGAGKPRCDSSVVGPNWEFRVVGLSELLESIDNVCWRCYYTDAPSRERKEIEKEQNCGPGMAVPFARWSEPKIEDFTGEIE